MKPDRSDAYPSPGGRPVLLDLFAGAGGAARGYQQAGFYVIGVDHKPQPRYAGDEFWQADALDFLEEALDKFCPFTYADAIHASPPCQAHTLHNGARDDHPDLIAPTRDLLEATGLPYVIENVVGAPLIEPFMLCGSSFGLGVPSLIRQLRRHRLFEANWDIGLIPPCMHTLPACGIYGDHFRMGRRSSQGEFSGATAIGYGSAAMGIDWMTWPELKEAIPPAYTEFIGAQLLAHVNARVAA